MEGKKKKERSGEEGRTQQRKEKMFRYSYQEEAACHTVGFPGNSRLGRVRVKRLKEGVSNGNQSLRGHFHRK